MQQKRQDEIELLEAKLADLQSELNLSDEEFERRLLKRLEQEIKFNQIQLEQDLRKEVAAEKKRISALAVSAAWSGWCLNAVCGVEPGEEFAEVGECEAAERDRQAEDAAQGHR